MENLYAIDDMLYTYDELVKNGLEEEIQYDYVEPVQFDLGNDIYLIFDNNNDNFEIIKESVASMYCTLNNDIIKQVFGFYGEFDIYMDERGRGLVVDYY